MERLHKVVVKAQASGQIQIMAAAGEQLLGIYDWQYAQRVFRKALSMVNADKGELALSFGFILLRHSRYVEAVEMLEIARGLLDSNDLRTSLILADAYERLHKFDKVQEMVDIALKGHPNSIPAHRLAASVARQEGRLDDAFKCLEGMDDKSVPLHWESARAWYEKGFIHDKAREYDKAMRCWQIAKQYYPKNPNYDLFQKQANFLIHHPDRVFDSLTPDHIQQWRQSAKNLPQSPPLTILAGHPRSGTTLIEQALNAHPQAISAEETTIFSGAIHGPLFEGKPSDVPQSQILDEIPKNTLKGYQQTYHTMLELAMGQKSNGRMVIDKNPDLLQLLPSVLRVFPEARILMALRDPRDILVSIFSQALPPNHNAICHLSLKSSAQFVAKRLGLWVKLRDKIPDITCVLKYEDTVNDFRHEVGRAIHHMGLEWHEDCANPAAQANQRVVQSPTYAAVREPVHKKAVERWKNYQPWLEPHMDTLNGVIESLGYQ